MTEAIPSRAHAAAATALAVLAAIVGVLALAPGADAKSFLPPDKKIFHGVSDTGDVADYLSFRDQTGAHNAVLQDFFHWGVPLGTGALQRWRKTRTRGVLSLSTAPGGQPEVIDPKAIALGRGDDYMLSINNSISESRQVVYIRLFPEMNGHWNPYSAFNADGSSRGSDHSTKWFKRAWQRFAIIVRGGPRAVLNERLRKRGMPRILRARSDNSKIYGRKGVPKWLPQPKVALMWVPQTSGSPAVKGNSPQSYWPGSRYVDWVGADVYGKYANETLWRNLTRLYKRYDNKPFLIGEYSPWDIDLGGQFVQRLFDWAEQHGRTRMLIYYRSVNPINIFNLQFYPASLNALRETLNSSRYMAKAPEYRKNG